MYLCIYLSIYIHSSIYLYMRQSLCGCNYSVSGLVKQTWVFIVPGRCSNIWGCLTSKSPRKVAEILWRTDVFREASHSRRPLPQRHQALRRHLGPARMAEGVKQVYICLCMYLSVYLPNHSSIDIYIYMSIFSWIHRYRDVHSKVNFSWHRGVAPLTYGVPYTEQPLRRDEK